MQVPGLPATQDPPAQGRGGRRRGGEGRGRTQRGGGRGRTQWGGSQGLDQRAAGAGPVDLGRLGDSELGWETFWNKILGGIGNRDSSDRSSRRVME